jgi:hypothetical protein
MRKLMIMLLLVMAMGWVLTGCESDSTAPDDELPAITEDDVANQSTFLAEAMLEVAPLALTFTPTKADELDGRYSYTFAPGDPLDGVVQLYFEQNGAPSGYDVADYGNAYTDDGAPITLTPVEDGVAWELNFDLDSEIDQGAGSAVVDGGGDLVIGSYVATWTVSGFAYAIGDDWPSAGLISFTNEGITAVVTFDGDETVTITIGSATWSYDFDNGTLTPL